jgi:monoamine oxidase
MSHVDVIIIGGGIAGLNCAHSLPKHLNVLLFEKHDLGGRIYTHKDANMVVEAGAARFNHNHVRLLKLLRHFNLDDKIIPLPTEDPVYIDTHNPSASYDDVKRVLKTVLSSSKKPSIHHTFLENAASIVSKGDISFLKKGFGYSAELTIMNARDAFHLLKTYETPFFVLQGGLSQLIVQMTKNIKHVPEEVLDVTFRDSVFHVVTATKTYTATVCISTVQRPNLERFTLAKPLVSKLQCIKSTPLCRIYANAHIEKKIITDSDLKMIIPISKTVAMVSYTDSVYAEKWKKIKDEGGDKAVVGKLRTLFRELDLEATMKNVNMFYWPYGVGYWGVGADSKKLQRELVRPFKHAPFFICGENFSSANQQWVEGALETSSNVVKLVKQLFKMRKTRKNRQSLRVSTRNSGSA